MSFTGGGYKLGACCHDPSMHPLRIKWIRAKRWWRQWLRTTVSDSIAPVFSGSAMLQYLVWVVIASNIFPAKDWPTYQAHFVNAWAYLFPFGFAFVCFVVVNAFRAIFKAGRELDKVGTWQGDQFIYHEPMHVLTVSVTAKNNDVPHIFAVPDAEDNSLVVTKMVFDAGQNSAVSAQIGWAKSPVVIGGNFHFGMNASLRLPKDRRLALWTEAIPEASPATIRVYISSWTL